MKLYSVGFLLIGLFVWLGVEMGQATCQPTDPDPIVDEIKPRGLT